MLVEEVGVRRTDYASGCWVSAHVEKIIEKHLKVTISIILFNIIHTIITIITFTTITTTNTTTIITMILNQIAKLLEGMPEAHRGFVAVCQVLQQLLPLLKAKRFLSEEERVTLET